MPAQLPPLVPMAIRSTEMFRSQMGGRTAAREHRGAEEPVMETRGLFKRRTTADGSIASLLATTGKPAAQARSEFVAATGVSPDLLVLDPNSAQFAELTQGFNRRWRERRNGIRSTTFRTASRFPYRDAAAIEREVRTG